MHLRGIGYAFAASFMFGLGAVLAKLVGSEIDAALVAFLDLAVGGLLLTACLAVTRTHFFKHLSGLKRADWINLFLLACPGTSLPLLLIVAGFARTSAYAPVAAHSHYIVGHTSGVYPHQLLSRLP